MLVDKLMAEMDRLAVEYATDNNGEFNLQDYMAFHEGFRCGMDFITKMLEMVESELLTKKDE